MRERALAHIEAEILVEQAITDTDGSVHDVFDLIKWRLGEMLLECGCFKEHYHEDAVRDMMRRLSDR